MVEPSPEWRASFNRAIASVVLDETPVVEATMELSAGRIKLTVVDTRVRFLTEQQARALFGDIDYLWED